MNEAAPADDSFHEPAGSDPFWTETSWYAFSIPERRLTGAVYPVFRPNQGVCSAGVYVWDDSADSLHAIRYARNWWHLPMPDHDLTELDLPNGLSYRTLEPLKRYAVRYDDGSELSLDLEYEALHAPHAPMLGATGHLDQACRVTGSIRLHGDELVVDGFEMRDRSWSVRKDVGPVRAGYSYLVGADRALLAMSIWGGDTYFVMSGYHLIEGDLVAVTGGSRRVERDSHGRPAKVQLSVTDAAGRRLEVTGTCVNRFAFQSSPNYFAWMSMADWELEGEHLFGEDQDVWSPDLLRQAQRQGYG